MPRITGIKEMYFLCDNKYNGRYCFLESFSSSTIGFGSEPWIDDRRLNLVYPLSRICGKYKKAALARKCPTDL